MKKIAKLILFGFLPLLFTSCEDKTIDLPDNYVSFSRAELGITGKEVSVELNLTRSIDEAGSVNITFESDDVEYGKQFITEPAAINNTISLTLLPGESKVQFKIIQLDGVLLSGVEKLKFKIANVNNPLIIGSQDNLVLTFSKIISSGGTLTLEAKTSESEYANTVYVDLSANSTKITSRKAWNLGFTNDSRFKVMLNYSYQTTAAKTTKTDINDVSLADVETTPDIYVSFARLTDPETKSLVDSWDGDLDNIVFDDVSADSKENFVYLVAFEGNDNPEDKWFKVKVDRSGNGYEVKYARIGETDIKTVTISKDADFNFSFLSFENGLVKDIEPQSNDWDIEYGYVTYNSGLDTPYWFRDFVNINSEGGAQAAEVLTSDVSYDNFRSSHISNVQFSGKRDAIAGKWRVTSGQELGVKKDRFYVVKDPEGNIYKLRFLNMGIGNDGGERGKPVIEYKLVD